MYKITNTNAFDFSARFDGQAYAFPQHQPVYCDDASAGHIFGIGLPDKSAILSRHGWANFTSGYAAGMDILNKFQFERVDPVFDAPMALVSEQGPAPLLQNALADDGGADEPPEPAGAVAAAKPKRGAAAAA